MRRSLALAALAALLPVPLLLGGCDGGSGDAIGSGGDYSVGGALAELPLAVADVEGGLVVETGDLGRASEIAAVDQPTEAGDDGANAAWLLALTGEDDDKAFVPLSPEPFQFAGAWGEMGDSYGWSPVDLDSFVSTTQLTVAHADGVELAGDLPTSDGLSLSADGDVGRLAPDADPMGDDPFHGIVTGMATDGDRLAFGTSADQLAAWQDGGRALAADEPLASVADALDEHEVYSAVLARGAPSGALPSQISADIRAVGVGWSEDAMWAVWAVDGDADAAADELEQAFDGTTATTQQPVSDLVSLEDISADGDVVVAELAPGPSGRLSTPYQMLLRGDGPFVGGR